MNKYYLYAVSTRKVLTAYTKKDKLNMLFFSKPTPEIKDTTDAIYLTRDGSSFHELSCDPMLYAQGLMSIRTILTNWIAEDRAIAADTAIDTKGTVSYLLNTLDVKMIPHAIYLEQLINIITDNEVNRGGSRLLDAIALIYTVVPTEVIECFKGKFLYGMLYGLSNVNNVLPTKEQWVHALAVIPWIPFIIIIQEILSTEYLGPNVTSSISGFSMSDTNDVVQQSQ
jgi:hypothetical protein